MLRSQRLSEARAGRCWSAERSVFRVSTSGNLPWRENAGLGVVSESWTLKAATSVKEEQTTQQKNGIEGSEVKHL